MPIDLNCADDAKLEVCMNVLTSDHHYFGTLDFPYGDEDD